MKNLEQVRAKNALLAARKYVFGGADGGEAVAKKVPAMIRENGFLAAAAFAMEKEKGYAEVFDACITHLSDPEIRLAKNELLADMVEKLSGATSDRLRLVTAESLAFLNYLRRFAGNVGN